MPGLLNKPLVSPILVGRAMELAILRQLMDQARRGQGQVICIAGEAGIGKSRLVREGVAYAAAHGFQVFRGSCFQPDYACAYAPILDLLHNQLASGAVFSGSNPFPAELSRLVPGLVPAASVSPPALDPEQEKRRLFAGLAQFFIQQASQQPLVLVIEDLHWSDDTSLSFLHFLARNCATQPLVILLTYRSEERPANLRQWLAQMDRARLSQEIKLAPLSLDNVDEILRAIFQRAQPVPRELLETLYALTEGNPFFLEEILSSLTTANANFTADRVWDYRFTTDLQLPRSVQEAVRPRTSQLSPAARQAVTQAAVIGRQFSFELLRHLTGLDEAALLAMIKELLAAQLIIEAANDQFAFRHALIQQVVYAELLSRERQALHQTIAETIESMYAAALESYWADLAYHFGRAEQWRAALTYSIQAGRRSQSLYAPRETVEHFTRALEAARHLAAPAEPEFYRARGQAYELLGEFDRARLDYETGLQLSQSADNQPAAWQSLLDLGQLWAGRNYTQAGDYYQRALESARALNDPASLAHSLNRLGNWYVNSEQPLAGQQFHREAAAIFEALHDQRGLAETYDLLGMASFRSSDLPGATAHYRRAIALFRQLAEPTGLISSLSMLTGCARNYSTSAAVPAAQSLADCLHTGQEGLQLARDISWRSGEAYAHVVLSWCLGAYGDYGQALRHAQTGLAIAEAIEHLQWMTAAHWGLGAIYLELLALPKAQQHLEQSLALAGTIGSAIWINHASGLLASTHLAQGNLPRAAAVLDTLPADLGWQTLGQRQCWCARAELAQARGQFAEALRIAQQLENAAFQAGAEQALLPRLTKLVSEALTGLQRGSEAEAALRQLVQNDAVQSLKPWLWRCHLALGQLNRGARRNEAAEREFTAARQLIQEIAAHVENESDRALFLQSAVAPIGKTPPRPANSSGLTARETEVARLVAQSASNRAIADKLVISERTVESHVSSILGKLNFTSRSQIVAWVIEHGLEQPHD